MRESCEEDKNPFYLLLMLAAFACSSDSCRWDGLSLWRQLQGILTWRHKLLHLSNLSTAPKLTLFIKSCFLYIDGSHHNFLCWNLYVWSPKSLLILTASSPPWFNTSSSLLPSAGFTLLHGLREFKGKNTPLATTEQHKQPGTVPCIITPLEVCLHFWGAK